MAKTKPCKHCGHSKGMHVKNVRPPRKCNFFENMKDGYRYIGDTHLPDGRPRPGVHRYYCQCPNYEPDERVVWENSVTITPLPGEDPDDAWLGL